MAYRAPRLRFTLVHKLVASYSAMVVFTTAALIFAILGLFSLNQTAREIAHNNLVFIDSLNKMRGSIVAQERSAGKYSILKENEFLTLFRRRQGEFKDLLKTIEKTHPEDSLVLERMYADFVKKSAPVVAGKTTDIVPVQEASNTIIACLDRLYSREQGVLARKVQSADREESSTVKWTVVLALSGFILAIGVAAYSVVKIASAITKLKKATHRIADGEFDFDPEIPPGDEIGELAMDFTGMAARLKVLEQISLDASPLTRLPGNIAIERALCRRLADGNPFAVYYADLDNFKAFNDRYGCIQASAVIKMSAEVIEQAVRAIADADAFVGHVGGDDFVVVADCEPAEPLCRKIIADFESEIVKYYSAEDLARGAIEGLDRYGVERVFPIMTISIAIIECGDGDYSSAMDIAKAAAEIKDHVKVFEGSNYMFNGRMVAR
ncbi:GGDEF domain-containing protein [Geomonas sp. Red276]